MIDPRLAPNWGWITLHACLAVIGWLVLSRYKLLNGVGGRLGAMTYVTGNVATFIAIAAGDADEGVPLGELPPMPTRTVLVPTGR